jgi:hypothetical protein
MSLKQMVGAALALTFFVLGPPPGTSQRAGPSLWLEVKMSNEKKPPDSPGRQAQAVTRPVKVRLDQLVLEPARFSHRDEVELTDPARLRPLADSIFANGLQVPIEIFTDDKGRRVVDSGYRRTSALRLLAKEKKPGYAPDMEVPAVEVSGATPQQLLLRSIADNCNRLTLSQTERIRATKTLADGGVSKEDAAKAFGVSTKQYERDLLIAQHPWMYDLVFKNAFTPSNASRLLEAAVAEKRVAELEAGATAWVGDTEGKIAEAKKKKKDLTAAQQLVRTYMTPALLNHWLAQIKKKEDLTAVEPAAADFEVRIEPEANRVSIGAAEIDLMMVPREKLAEYVVEVESAKKVMLTYLKARKVVEAQGPQDVAREESKNPTGLEVLREAGLGDLADEVELKRMEEAEQARRPAEGQAEEASEGE